MVTEQKYVCIYCRESKMPDEFGREHVLHDGFGKYDPVSFVLKDKRKKIYKVCHTCNNTFGITIDQDLLRATYEGVQRFNSGIKDQAKFDPKEYAKNQKLFINEGILKGLEVVRYFLSHVVPGNDDIALRKVDGTYDFYPVTNLPGKEIAEQTYPSHPEKILILCPQKKDQAINAIKEKWDCDYLDYVIYEDNSERDVRYEAKYDKSVFRAIAKIAFNYLAYFNDSMILLQDCFNPIRDFIVSGVGEWQQFLQVSQKPILHEENGKAISGHVITYDTSSDGSIIASVSLFNALVYEICLAPHYKGSPFKIRSGHLFDPHGHKIHELGNRKDLK